MTAIKRSIWQSRSKQVVSFFWLGLVLLCACNRSSNWAVERIETGEKAFDSAKLCYRSADRLRGLDLEFMRTADTLHAYLNAHSQPVPAAKDNPKAAEAQLLINGQSHPFSAIRYAGGQRLKLPEATRDTLIAALQAGQAVTIQLRGYKTTIEPKSFAKFFKKMENAPLLSPSLLEARLL